MVAPGVSSSLFILREVIDLKFWTTAGIDSGMLPVVGVVGAVGVVGVGVKHLIGNLGNFRSNALPLRTSSSVITRMPCIWLGMITNSSRWTFEKCPGIFSHCSRAISPTAVSRTTPATTLPNRCSFLWLLIVRK